MLVFYCWKLEGQKKKGFVSIVSFVDKVASPFSASYVELFGSDDWWEDVVSALSQNRFILSECCITHTHTHTSSETLILHRGRIGNTSCQITCAGLCSPANMCSVSLQISFVVSSFFFFIDWVQLGTLTCTLQMEREWLCVLKMWGTNLKLWMCAELVEDLHMIKVVSAPFCQNITWHCLPVFSVCVCVRVCFKSPCVTPLSVCGRNRSCARLASIPLPALQLQHKVREDY